MEHAIVKGNGFFAALDSSGGSTAQALSNYGVKADAYSNDNEMMGMMHEFRKRIIQSTDFNPTKIAAAILFKDTVNRSINGKPTVDYLKDIGIPSFLKIDKGLQPEYKGVQVMETIKGLYGILYSAKNRGIVGTKARSVIKRVNTHGIKFIVNQQFSMAEMSLEFGLIPIMEPEVSINSPSKQKAEDVLLESILKHLDMYENGEQVIFKLTPPTEPNLYKPLVDHPNVAKVIMLSGGYNQAEAVEKVSQNDGAVASFSRALLEGLNVNQTDDEFNHVLSSSIYNIYGAQ